MDPCNDGYEETERVRILGDAYRNETTLKAWRAALRRDRDIHLKIAFWLVMAVVVCITAVFA